MNANPPVPTAVQPSERLTSLDAYRGFIMLLMASSGFGFGQVASHFPDHPGWRFLGRQCEHTAWTGCTLWDLIQPAFMFMVGVAVPYSIASRLAKGQSFGRLFRHALWRSLLLVWLGVFLSSAWSRQTNWSFVNVLSQIGLGYTCLFLLYRTSDKVRWSVAAAILFLYWLAFAFYPPPPAGFDFGTVGLPENWPHLSGFAQHWDKNTNLAAAFDGWFLNLFPRETPFAHQAGGYQTLNFVPSLVTMLLGLQAGLLLRSERPLTQKLQVLVGAGMAGLLAGAALDWTGVCPMVKRIWTPAWVLFSGGWVTLMLATFVALTDWRGWKRWAFPFCVAGLNPITLYMMWQLMPGFIRQQLQIHFGTGVFTFLGEPYEPILQRVLVLCVLWLIVWWLYRRRIFVRI